MAKASKKQRPTRATNPGTPDWPPALLQHLQQIERQKRLTATEILRHLETARTYYQNAQWAARWNEQASRRDRARDHALQSVINRLGGLPFHPAWRGWLQGTLKTWRITPTGEREPRPSRRLWRPWWTMPALSVVLVDRIQQATGGSEIDACATAADILTLASGQRFTPQMVKHRVRKGHDEK